MNRLLRHWLEPWLMHFLVYTSPSLGRTCLTFDQPDCTVSIAPVWKEQQVGPVWFYRIMKYKASAFPPFSITIPTANHSFIPYRSFFTTHRNEVPSTFGRGSLSRSGGSLSRPETYHSCGMSRRSPGANHGVLLDRMERNHCTLQPSC